MKKLLKVLFVSFLYLFIISSVVSAYTEQEALDLYVSSGCSLVTQTKEQICWRCTPTPYPDCASPINFEVTQHWSPTWDGIPDCVVECQEGWNRAIDMSCICDAVVCIPDGSCSALEPVCGETTVGSDNCGNPCEKVGEACPILTCEDGIEYCTNATDCVANGHEWYNDTCNVNPDITPPPDTSFDEESNGLVTILAVDFEANDNFGSATYSWVQEGNLMTAVPEDAIRFDSPTSPSLSPMLSYNIRVTTGGAYYFWVKGIRVSGTSDSLHFGIDKVFLDSMTLLDTSSWSNLLQDYTNKAMITLVPGDYVLNIWMREDGTKLEEFVFAKDPNWVP